VNKRIFILPIAASALLLSACSDGEEEVVYGKQRKTKGKLAPYHIKGVWYHPQSHYHLEEEGIASYYGINDNEHEGPDAMGGTYNMHKMTAAHKTLPLPSIVRVHNLHNNRQAIVAITDRGPFVDGRVIDLSVKAAKSLGFFGKGIAKVRIKSLEKESQIFARLTHKVCLKSCNLSDLLPQALKLAQADPEQCLNSAPEKVLADASVLMTPKHATPSFVNSPALKKRILPNPNVRAKHAYFKSQGAKPPRLSKPLYVSIQNLSFDQAMWVRVQSVTYKWGHPRLQKRGATVRTPFMSLVGPFVSVTEAQKALRFFLKHDMSAIVLPLS
jgi:rare lipoprotein A (peptidoglycan hydrolase)